MLVNLLHACIFHASLLTDAQSQSSYYQSKIWLLRISREALVSRVSWRMLQQQSWRLIMSLRRSISRSTRSSCLYCLCIAGVSLVHALLMTGDAAVTALQQSETTLEAWLKHVAAHDAGYAPRKSRGGKQKAKADTSSSSSRNNSKRRCAYPATAMTLILTCYN